MLYPLANRLIALDSGKVAADDITEEAVRRISAHPALAESMSAPVKLYYSLGAGGKCPLTVKDGERVSEKPLQKYRKVG